MGKICPYLTTTNHDIVDIILVIHCDFARQLDVIFGDSTTLYADIKQFYLYEINAM